MRKKLRRLFLFAACIALCALLWGAPPSRVRFSYDSQKAAQYALQYAMTPNPDYPLFWQNCTNFVSQCLVAGGLPMSDAPAPSSSRFLKIGGTFNEFYCVGATFSDTAPQHYSLSSSFVNTGRLIAYLKANTYCQTYQFTLNFDGKAALAKQAAVGDVLILQKKDQSVFHLGLITKVDGQSVCYSGNTNNRENADIMLLPVGEITYVSLLHFL